MKRAIHPAADLFPMMGNQELAALAADIRSSGLRESIKLAEDGSVLDGRNRLAACKLAKVEPVFETVLVDDPVAFVVSANVMRRNLSKQQTAIAAAESWVMYGGPPTRGGDRSKPQKSGLTHAKLGAMWGISENYLMWATALVRVAGGGEAGEGGKGRSGGLVRHVAGRSPAGGRRGEGGRAGNPGG